MSSDIFIRCPSRHTVAHELLPQNTTTSGIKYLGLAISRRFFTSLGFPVFLGSPFIICILFFYAILLQRIRAVFFCGTEKHSADDFELIFFHPGVVYIFCTFHSVLPLKYGLLRPAHAWEDRRWWSSYSNPKITCPV